MIHARVEGSLAPDRMVDSWRISPHFWAGIRFGLGLAQMFMATFSVVLLLKSGINRFTLIAAGFTTLLTLASRMLFHGQPGK